MEYLDVSCTELPAEDPQVRAEMAGAAFQAALLVAGVSFDHDTASIGLARPKEAGTATPAPMIYLDEGDADRFPKPNVPKGSIVIGFAVESGDNYGAIRLSVGEDAEAEDVKVKVLRRIKAQANRFGIPWAKIPNPIIDSTDTTNDAEGTERKKRKKKRPRGKKSG